MNNRLKLNILIVSAVALISTSAAYLLEPSLWIAIGGGLVIGVITQNVFQCMSKWNNQQEKGYGK